MTKNYGSATPGCWFSQLKPYMVKHQAASEQLQSGQMSSLNAAFSRQPGYIIYIVI